MTKYFQLQHPHVRAKIIGIPLFILGIVSLVFATSLSIKIGFTAILIGLFMIFLITEKTIPKTISDTQIQGTMDVIDALTRELNLTGNATFLPKTPLRTDERVFIPLQTTTTSLPKVDDTVVFSTGTDGKSLGIALPPSGLRLLFFTGKTDALVLPGSHRLGEVVVAGVHPVRTELGAQAAGDTAAVSPDGIFTHAVAEP